MQIDHDPREPSHKAVKLIALLTLGLTLVFMVPVVAGIRWTFDQMPEWIVLLIFPAFVIFACGFYFGRWDAKRQFRTPGND
ncbi:hypothetical protein [Rhizobium sp. Root651]|uniref:hypothetical protein n=1 Tax=Rhizobium sp. Root651 TaxID=1736577 RepID=UPI000715FB79|nr:hypothetical protein [Rhizobium sp. Root651]KRA59036.1 hypothetical protein ASD85_15220 [Rhizobium sp. Root651]